MAKTKDKTRLTDKDPELLVRLLFRDLDEEQKEFYRRMKAAVAVCRGKRRHDFAGLVPGQPVPDSVEIRRVQGVYEVTEHCRRKCGRWITYLAGRDGVPDYTSVRYGGWQSGVELATGLGLNVSHDRDYMRFIQAEVVEQGFALQEKRRAAAAAEQARRERTGPPSVKFRGAAVPEQVTA